MTAPGTPVAAKAPDDPVEAAVRALRRQGASLAQIAYALRETGASAPGGGAWTTRAIARVLKRGARPGGG